MICRKEQFATPEAAERQIQRMRDMRLVHGTSANAYFCDECSAWHWGRADRADRALSNLIVEHERAARVAKWPPRIGRLRRAV